MENKVHIKENDVKSLIEDIYSDYLNKLSKESERSPGKGFFRVSSTGFCIRKNYYSFKETESTNPPNKKTMRIFRLGNLIHVDLQESLNHFMNNE